MSNLIHVEPPFCANPAAGASQGRVRAWGGLGRGSNGSTAHKVALLPCGLRGRTIQNVAKGEAATVLGVSIVVGVALAVAVGHRSRSALESCDGRRSAAVAACTRHELRRRVAGCKCGGGA